MNSNLPAYESSTAAGLLSRGLQQLGPLSDQERSVVESASFPVRQVEGHQDLAREGDRPTHCPLLLEGFACRYKTLDSGQRQVMALHMRTDLCDLTSLLLGTLDYSIATLTPVRVALVPHATIFDWTRRLPGLSHLLWWAALVDTSVSREWIINVGRRTAIGRTAHLLCELVLRMRSAGLADEPTCRLPLTQVMLADAFGLTAVHANRTLQWLRSENLIEFSSGVLTVLDWSGLKRAGGFDPAYLHQPKASGRR